MALTSLTGVIAGLQPSVSFVKAGSAFGGGVFQNLWGRAGNPVAGGWNTTLNGAVLTAPVIGQIPWSDPPSNNAYLARCQFRCPQSSILFLCDRLWHNGGFDVTSVSAQNITSPTWPARDENGSTSGQGIYLALEISAGVGAGTPTITVAYTDSDNNTQTSTSILNLASLAGSGSVYFIELAPGSRGVKSVQSLTLSETWTSGSINLVAFRLIASIEQYKQGVNAIDAITGGMPRLYPGSVLFLYLMMDTTSTATISGKIEYTWG